MHSSRRGFVPASASGDRPRSAAASATPLLHPALGCNIISDRSFRYGDPETAFAGAAHRIAVATTYPRNSGSPLEGFVVIAEYLPGEGIYEVTANFQGPLAMHPAMALALGVPANRLRLKTRRIPVEASAPSTRSSPISC